MPVFNNILAGAAGSGGAAAGYKIERSIRLNSSDSAHLSRTPSSAGNRKTWTWSGWVKRTAMGADKFIFSAGSDPANFHYLRFTASDTLEATEKIGDSVQLSLITSAVFRDPSAWYHIIYVYDSTQATAADRLSLYVNGVKITSFSTSTYPSQNHDSYINSTSNHIINGRPPATYSDFYLAEIHSLDGTAVSDATNFGEYDDNNVWQPIEYAGTYGPLLNQSYTWSSSTGYVDSDNPSGKSSANIFDGNLTTYVSGRPSSTEVTLANSITAQSKIRFYGAWENIANARWAVNGTATDAVPLVFTNNTTFGWSEPTNLTFPLTITSVGVLGATAGAGGRFVAVEVDGKLLVDSGISVSHNGFYLDFSDNSSAAALGYDAAGSNDWTVNNLSVASGAGNDSLIDTPTNYTSASGNNGGNYATLNPLHNGQTLSNGNLDVVGTSSWQRSVSTIAMSSGKWYWEYEITASNEHIVGVGPLDMQMGGNLGAGSPPGSGYGTELGQVNGTGANSSWTNTGGSTTGDVIGVAFDADAGNMYIYKNGTSLNSGIPSHTGLTNGPYYAVFSLNGSSRSGTVNFGQRPFKYTNAGTNRPAATYLSLCTQNLADPTIADGSTAMDAKLYTGNGSTQTISGLDFSPDLVWIKNRSQGDLHVLTDTVRGATKQLSTSSNVGETTNADGLTAFNSDGFDLGADVAYNTNTESYIAWTWDGGTSTVTNTDGDLNSQVRANPSTGFSISTHSRTTAASISTWGHGLGAAPEFAILKPTNGTYNWFAWHKDAGNNKRFYISSSSAGNTYAFDVWSSDSTTLGIYGTIIAGGGTALDCLTYAWTPVEGYSAFGSYTGNGSADGPFVFTGFRPRWLMTKRTDSSTSGDWNLVDTARGTYNVVGPYLYANQSAAEGTAPIYDILSNGFKIRESGAGTNASGGTYIYAAFGDPFKTARAR